MYKLFTPSQATEMLGVVNPLLRDLQGALHDALRLQRERAAVRPESLRARPVVGTGRGRGDALPRAQPGGGRAQAASPKRPRRGPAAGRRSVKAECQRGLLAPKGAPVTLSAFARSVGCPPEVRGCRTCRFSP